MTARATERAVTIVPDGGSPVLEGLFLAADVAGAGAVVAAPHPQMGGSMDHPVLGEVANACTKAGVASLRFNWRGAGGSAGSPSGDPEHGDADYAAAVSFVEESVAGPLVAAGYSYGAAIAVRAAARHPRIRRLLLVSPPTMMLDHGALESFPGAVLIVTAERDEYAPPAALKALADALARGTFHLVPGADHFYQLGLAEISRAAERWL